MSEGGKILFRIGLATLKIHEDKLLRCLTASNFEKTLARLMMTETECEKLIQTALNIPSLGKKMLMKMHSTHRIEHVPFARVKVFHLPEFSDGMSKLLKIRHVRMLWKHLDPIHAIQVRGKSIKIKILI